MFRTSKKYIFWFWFRRNCIKELYFTANMYTRPGRSTVQHCKMVIVFSILGIKGALRPLSCI